MNRYSFFSAFLATLIAAIGQASDSNCPAVPKLTEYRRGSHGQDISRQLSPYSIYQTVANYYDAPLGVGHLKLNDAATNAHFYDWMFKLRLPLWSKPDAAHALGWLIAGQVHFGAPTGVTPLTGAGMVEVAYEHTNFIVWETTNDWLKLQLDEKTTAWTHMCHLKSADLDLQFQSWQDFFRHQPDWLHFRRPVAHRLRMSPDVRSERVTTIGLDHKLSLMEIQGDWMRVKVEQPDTTCGADSTSTKQHEGWVKWRDDTGPWIYVYTRGC